MARKAEETRGDERGSRAAAAVTYTETRRPSSQPLATLAPLTSVQTESAIRPTVDLTDANVDPKNACCDAGCVAICSRTVRWEEEAPKPHVNRAIP